MEEKDNLELIRNHTLFVVMSVCFLIFSSALMAQDYINKNLDPHSIEWAIYNKIFITLFFLSILTILFANIGSGIFMWYYKIKRSK